MNSLKRLYSLTMDVHNRLRTESHKEIVARFNERFILSLGSCKRCLVMDDEFNILPISSQIRAIQPVHTRDSHKTPEQQELDDLLSSLGDIQPIRALVTLAKTVDQAKAELVFIEAITEKTLRSTVALTAARGRGKSAAMGIALAAAIAFSYSNIFVTSPSPENLKTLFEFLFKGFDVMGYKERVDYELVESTNPEFNRAIVRVNVFRNHRQTVQYIQPQDYNKLAQAELLVIDEAAAIPLPLVKKLLGSYLVFMASTINGYEGTGRSLSLKLVQQLRSQTSSTDQTSGGPAKESRSLGGRVLREVTLETPIRYSPGDDVEKWLYQLLCLDATSASNISSSTCPPPSKCELYYVNKDTLFSFHKESEEFLQRMMALYVSSHYKNSPNDLQLMSDAPSHHLFVLLGPVLPNTKKLPDILAVLQVSLEGKISRESAEISLSKGELKSGDLIPWTVSQQFQDFEFANLSGARVVRIATHPDLQRMGYGGRAMEQLIAYYKGFMTDLSEDREDGTEKEEADQEKEKDEDEEEDEEKEEKNRGALISEKVEPRKNLPPLLSKLEEVRAPKLDYVGVAYGLTPQLFKFWRRNSFQPVYLRQTPNEITGEHSCIMLHSLDSSSVSSNWIDSFAQDFKRRFLTLLSFEFSSFPSSLALTLLDIKSKISLKEDLPKAEGLSKTEMDFNLTPYDLKRLTAFSKNQVEYHLVADLLPLLSRLFFMGKLRVELPSLQAAVLLAFGLQHKTVEVIAEEFGLAGNQVIALMTKLVKKLTVYLSSIQEAHIAETIPERAPLKLLSKKTDDKQQDPNDKMSLDDDQKEESEKEEEEEEEEKKDEKGEAQDDDDKPIGLSKKKIMSAFGKEFRIRGTDEDWKDALSSANSPHFVSLKVQGKKNKLVASKTSIKKDIKKAKKTNQKDRFFQKVPKSSNKTQKYERNLQ
eukprot:TRINITY_DN14772_c0_g1_i1.p1 TRINITY_DN14772_c0_g1~~TRINITY_DN14772_c0_g1_i1.p1  ORF type:complete len:1086 (+),score=284.98 TRINITY_DN14772_c0_g1_i1:469-3258(+)